MHLHRFSFNRGNIKGLKAIDERHRNNRAFGTERTFEGAAFEIQDLISVPASRPFCKNQVVSPSFTSSAIWLMTVTELLTSSLSMD